MKYVIDPTSPEPIFLIDTHIGNDKEAGPGIMGDEFSRELLYIDTLNPKRIQIWINSPGGVIVDGMQIFNTMLKVKAKVDTYCVGIACSIAFPIFAAGRTRYMVDNTKLMTHEASGPAGSGLNALEDSVKTMIISRSGGKLNEESLNELMKLTTWIKPEEARDKYGVCDVVEYGSDFNKARKVAQDLDAMNTWKEYKLIVNSVIENKKKPMEDLKQICNKLDLVENTSVTGILKAIEKKEADYLKEITEVKNSYTAKKTELDKMKNDLDEMTEKYNKMKNEFDTMKNDADTAATNALGKEADAVLGKAVELGQIKNEAEVLKTWKDKYVKDKPGTVALLDSLGINSKAPDVSELQNKAEDGVSAEVKEVQRIEKLIGHKYGSAEYMNYVKINEARKK